MLTFTVGLVDTKLFTEPGARVVNAGATGSGI
jgi:hypothetical protein